MEPILAVTVWEKDANSSFPSVLSQSYMNFKGNAINILKILLFPSYFLAQKKRNDSHTCTNFKSIIESHKNRKEKDK